VSLTHKALDISVASECNAFLGSLERISAINDEYFNSVHACLPMVSQSRLKQEISEELPDADIGALCLSMLLVQQRPSEVESMQSPVYVTTKRIISLLEAAEYWSLSMVQCRVLVTFYEMGHGLHPAESISLSACAKAARFIGLDRDTADRPVTRSDLISAEERRRTRWAIFNMDRLVQYQSSSLKTPADRTVTSVDSSTCATAILYSR